MPPRHHAPHRKHGVANWVADSRKGISLPGIVTQKQHAWDEHILIIPELTLPTAQAGGFLGRTRRTRQTESAVTGLHVRWRLGYRPRSTGVNSRRPYGIEQAYHNTKDALLSPGLKSGVLRSDG
jgi:hypothetical protein